MHGEAQGPNTRVHTARTPNRHTLVTRTHVCRHTHGTSTWRTAPTHPLGGLSHVSAAPSAAPSSLASSSLCLYSPNPHASRSGTRLSFTISGRG